MRKIHKNHINVLTTLMRQLISTLCGILMPRILIGAFGSVVYGATTSVAQFLSVISLLEGGIGRVARGELYEPLARGDTERISRIHRAIRRFFLKIAGVFLVYTLVIAWFYNDIAADTVFDRTFTFGLVVATSLTAMANYLGGIADLTLMNADQKQYLSNTVTAVTSILNVLLMSMLVWAGANILIVKYATAFVFVSRRVFYSCYVRHHYKLPRTEKGFRLEQQWTGLGQHLAFFLHSNTDIILLTLFADLKLVAVYSIYYLVVRSIWDISSSFSGGMEAAFGELIARGKQRELERSCGKYTMMLTLVSVLLFGCTGVLIVPFVRLYMAGITDVNYIQPLFALILILAETMNCLALPFTTLPISANRLKQTRWGSYGEAIVNVGLSLLLVRWDPLLGVALGTLAATVFKALFYMTYSARRILHISLWGVFGRFAGAAGLILAVSCVGMTALWSVPMESFIVWCLWGGAVFLAVGAVAVLFGMAAFPGQMHPLFEKMTGHKGGR